MPRDLLAEREPRDLLADEAASTPNQAYSGGILPFSIDEQGNRRFDANAGIFGAFKRAFTLPGEVYQGQIDPLSREGIERAMQAAPFYSPINPAIRSGGRAIPGTGGAARKTTPKPPTAEALKDAAEAGYKEAREMGVEFSSKAVGRMASQTKIALEEEGFLAELAPKSFRILKRLEQPPKHSIARLAGLDAARKALRKAAQDFTNPTEQAVASRIIARLDEFTEKPSASAVVAGPAAAAGKIQATARANYAAAKRSETVTQIAEDAIDAAKATNSGRNIGNTVRRSTAQFLKKPKKTAGYSVEEIAKLRKVAHGTFMRNRLRETSNMMAGGGGWGGTTLGMGGAALGGLAGGAPGAVAGASIPFIGQALRAGSNKLTLNALKAADELIRMRSPLYERMAQQAPMQAASPEARAAALRLFLLTQSQPQGLLGDR